MKITLSEQLILGILAEKPRHGYDIEKLIVERGMRKWTDIGFSSIYYVLDRLEARKLVKGMHSEGKEKKQYWITRDGMEQLKSAAKALIAERKPANTALMTGLAVSEFLDPSDYHEALTERQAQLTADLETLASKQAQAQFMPPAAQRLFSLSEVLVRTELAWVTNELERTQ